jgi:anti-sigma B factor antagonist
MNPNPRRKRLEIEEVGEVTIVRLADKKILDEQNIQRIGDELFALIDKHGKKKILIDFSGVEHLGSAANGKLITLAKKVQNVKGKLAFCGIDPEIYEVFEITKLDKFFGIRVIRDPIDSAPDWLAFFRRHVVYSCPTPGCSGSTRSPDHRLQHFRFEADRCPVCGLVYRPALYSVPLAGEAVGPVLELSLPTYEREAVHADLDDRMSVLEVRGRLDLFAFDALKRIWELLPLPQRILFDLNQTTEISERAARAVVDLALREGQGPMAILADNNHDEQADRFGNRFPRFRELAAVLDTFVPRDGDVLGRPMIRIHIEE